MTTTSEQSLADLEATQRQVNTTIALLNLSQALHLLRQNDLVTADEAKQVASRACQSFLNAAQ